MPLEASRVLKGKGGGGYELQFAFYFIFFENEKMVVGSFFRGQFLFGG